MRAETRAPVSCGSPSDATEGERERTWLIWMFVVLERKTD
jgi:hypothetical protein